MNGNTLLYLAIGAGVLYFILRPAATDGVLSPSTTNVLTRIFAAPLHCPPGQYNSGDFAGNPLCIPVGSVS